MLGAENGVTSPLSAPTSHPDNSSPRHEAPYRSAVRYRRRHPPKPTACVHALLPGCRSTLRIIYPSRIQVISLEMLDDVGWPRDGNAAAAGAPTNYRARPRGSGPSPRR